MIEHYSVEMRLDIKVPMRDGVELSADIYLPQLDETGVGGPWPTVLMRTPYSNNGDILIERGRMLANSGYAVVIQDVRGRWDSDGVYYAFHQEVEDGYDTQEWVSKQPWCDGNIGMTGASYGGATQWLSAPLAHPAVKCLVPRVMCVDYYDGLMHPGGAFQLNVMMTWGMRTNGRTGQSIDYHNWTDAFRSLPVIDLDGSAGRDLPFWKDWLNHPSDDGYWDEVNITDKYDQIMSPAYIMGGWYDLYAKDVFDEFVAMRTNSGSLESKQSRLIVGPWPHRLAGSQKTGDVDFGANSLVDLDGQELRWFDYWLKGDDTKIAEEPPIKLFIMGVNEWREEHEWPLPRTDWQKWYLHSGGEANGLLGDGTISVASPQDESTDNFTYNPEYPVQTVGGNNCCSPEVVPWGPYDQRGVEMRPDVLVYSSDPLESDMTVIGPIKLVLHAATDGVDTDWTAKLVDVSPSGYAMNLCDGIVRTRYRDSFKKPEMLTPSEIYEYEFDVGVTGNVFKAGHQIRLEVSSSNFPRYDRNLNTGEDNGTSTEMRSAEQTVHHSAARPSHIVLPIIPA